MLSAWCQGGAISRSPGGGLETAAPCEGIADRIRLTRTVVFSPVPFRRGEDRGEEFEFEAKFV